MPYCKYLVEEKTKDYQIQTDEFHWFDVFSEDNSSQKIEIPNFDKTTEIAEAFHDSKSSIFHYNLIFKILNLFFFNLYQNLGMSEATEKNQITSPNKFSEINKTNPELLKDEPIKILETDKGVVRRNASVKNFIRLQSADERRFSRSSKHVKINV